MTKKQIADKLHANIFAQADVTGRMAAEKVIPPVMVVRSDDGQVWEVPDGPCGFAWVTLRPSNSPAGNYAKAHGWRPAYGGGVQLWVSDYNQSMVRKEAYARAYADTLREHGLTAYAGSRMD